MHGIPWPYIVDAPWARKRHWHGRGLHGVPMAGLLGWKMDSIRQRCANGDGKHGHLAQALGRPLALLVVLPNLAVSRG